MNGSETVTPEQQPDTYQLELDAGLSDTRTELGNLSQELLSDYEDHDGKYAFHSLHEHPAAQFPLDK